VRLEMRFATAGLSGSRSTGVSIEESVSLFDEPRPALSPESLEPLAGPLPISEGGEILEPLAVPMPAPSSAPARTESFWSFGVAATPRARGRGVDGSTGR